MTKVIRIGTDLSENKVGAINIITATDQDVSRSVVGILKDPTGEYALDVSGVIRCSAVQVDASAVNFVYPSQLSQYITGSLFVTQDVSINEDLVVEGTSTLNNDVSINGDLVVSQHVSISGDLVVDGSSNLNDDVTISGDLVVTGTNVKMCNLDISDTGDGQTLITSTGSNGDIIVDVSDIFKIRDVNTDTDILYVDASNQRVGIKTDSPGTELHVNGTGKFDGNVGIGVDAGSYGLNVEGEARIGDILYVKNDIHSVNAYLKLFTKNSNGSAYNFTEVARFYKDGTNDNNMKLGVAL